MPACYRPSQPTGDNCNCGDFQTKSHATWFHNNYDPNDYNKLDSDGDHIACEGLPD